MADGTYKLQVTDLCKIDILTRDIYLLALYAEGPFDWLKGSYLMKVWEVSHNGLKLS